MKGVILSTSFFIMTMIIFLTLGWYVNYEHNQSFINNNLKKSLFYVAELLKESEEINEEIALDLLVDNLSPSLLNNFNYKFEILGFNDDPILMRIRLHCTSKNNFYKFTLEETLIEKEIENEE